MVDEVSDEDVLELLRDKAAGMGVSLAMAASAASPDCCGPHVGEYSAALISAFLEVYLVELPPEARPVVLERLREWNATLASSLPTETESDDSNEGHGPLGPHLH